MQRLSTHHRPDNKHVEGSRSRAHNFISAPIPLVHHRSCVCMATQGSGVKTRTGAKRPGAELDRNTMTATTSTGTTAVDGYEEGVTPVPLKYVVQEAVKRWFEDTMQEAQRGDVKQQALLGQMYAEGYGVGKDLKAGKEWTDKASSKGYRMQGVYCEL